MALWQLAWLLLSLASISWPLAPSHTKYKQTLKIKPVNTHKHTQHWGAESDCQKWRLAERFEMLWHFSSLRFPRLLWMLQQCCQPKRRPVWNILWAHTFTDTPLTQPAHCHIHIAGLELRWIFCCFYSQRCRFLGGNVYKDGFRLTLLTFLWHKKIW